MDTAIEDLAYFLSKSLKEDVAHQFGKKAIEDPVVQFLLNPKVLAEKLDSMISE